jgi:lysophospholipase L1-like esterase
MRSPRIFALAAVFAAFAIAQSPFYLKDGDRVVFYGDSITDQRLYTTFVETFVLTRFPSLDVRFIHSGWGGDRVTGGQGGRIDVRLARDVFAHKPTVVTVMLGMNDGHYRPFEQPIYNRFIEGYDRLITTLKTELPRARLTVIQPSPYDDVTRPPFEGGSYNAVMLRFGAFIRQVATREHLTFADFNSDLVRVLRKVNAEDAKAALQLIPDRVHPTAAGHLVMTQALLKAWQAPALVTSVELDAAQKRVVIARNTHVADLDRDGAALRWTQLDGALPMPVDISDPVIELAVEASDFVRALDQQPLKVTGLPAGPYALRIDDQQIGVFRGSELQRGINLATLPTPMLKQANQVHDLTLKHNDIYFTRWRHLQTPLEKDGAQRTAAALDALDTLEQEIVDRQHAAARPRQRRFELTPVSAVAANVPVGFTPVFGSGELRRVLLDGDRHKNFEVYLEVEGAAEAAARLVLRMTDSGQGFRVALDAREGASFGRIEVANAAPPKDAKPGIPWQEHWRKADWNAVRVRVDGDRPHITVWLNGAKITDWIDGGTVLTDDEFDGWGLAAIELPLDKAPHFRNVALRRMP